MNILYGLNNDALSDTLSNLNEDELVLLSENINNKITFLEECEDIIVKLNYEVCVLITNDNVAYAYTNRKSDTIDTSVFKENNIDTTKAYMTHNHPFEYTEFSFSREDIQDFDRLKLDVLRGIDKYFVYEINTSNENTMPLSDEDATDEALFPNAGVVLDEKEDRDYDARHHEILLYGRGSSRKYSYKRFSRKNQLIGQ